MFRQYFSWMSCIICLFIASSATAGPIGSSSFPSVPPDYIELDASSLISNAKPVFPDYYVNKTNGYQVTAPSGARFVVNSITQPKCAIYATYVSTDESGHLTAGTGNNPAVVSNVYVGEVNFDKCQ